MTARKSFPRAVRGLIPLLSASALLLTVQPARADWDYHTRYVVRVTTGIETLHGAHPPEDLLLTFTTECAPGDEAACAEPNAQEPAEDTGCSCRAGERPAAQLGWTGLAIAGILLVLRRRR